MKSAITITIHTSHSFYLLQTEIERKVSTWMDKCNISSTISYISSVILIKGQRVYAMYTLSGCCTFFTHSMGSNKLLGNILLVHTPSYSTMRGILMMHTVNWWRKTVRYGGLGRISSNSSTMWLWLACYISHVIYNIFAHKMFAHYWWNLSDDEFTMHIQIWITVSISPYQAILLISLKWCEPMQWSILSHCRRTVLLVY